MVASKYCADCDKDVAADGRAGVVACRSLLGDTEDYPAWHPNPSWLRALGHIEAGARHVQFGKFDATHRVPDCRL